jgi:hypothetical protein
MNGKWFLPVPAAKAFLPVADILWQAVCQILPNALAELQHGIQVSEQSGQTQ